MPPAIRLSSVARGFDGRPAVAPVTLDVPRGQFLALLGPSGCGKSTLLKMIAGLDRPTTGDVVTDASDVVSFVFQDAHLLPWRNVIENVTLPLEFAGTSRAERHHLAAAAIERVGLPTAVHRQYPAQLSGGMRMRVSLARALVNRPTLLLLDEPFAALDEITRQQLDDLLRSLWQSSGVTVVFVTHSIQEAVYLADRAVVFSRRPARVMLDTPIDLPATRSADLRTTTTFAEQSRHIFDALVRGEQS